MTSIVFVAAVGLTLLVVWLLKRLATYEEPLGSPRRLFLNPIADSCPSCGGALRSARVDDEYGAVLYLASENKIMSDGSLIFEQSHRHVHDSFRGVGYGAYCMKCHSFLLPDTEASGSP